MKSSPATDNDVVAEEGSNESGAFDPTQWEPGRVFVRQSVNPVDSLSMGDDALPKDVMRSEFAGENRMWVCEVRDESLQGGSYVVVSPLGSVDDEALPVRADRKGIIGVQDQTETKAAESTATTEHGKQEEA